MIKKNIKKILPGFVLDFYHRGWALASALWWGFPGRKLKVIGVTGTNGKTTTVTMIEAVLEQAGFKTAVLSSIYFKVGEEKEKNRLRLTMPGRGFIQGFLKRAVKAGCDCAVIEVTSEGVAQHRHRFCGFDTAVLTNLSPEHIEAHGSFENYKRAKGRFFKAVKGTHILNRDDKHFPYFDRFESENKYYYGREEVEGGEKGWKVEGIESSSQGSSFRVGETDFRVSLLGEFNVYNGLAAICVGISEGSELEVLSRGLEKVKQVAGRVEEVIEEPFTVIVDYAFTPNALKQVYETITANYKLPTTHSKLICVLGACGGGRDKWKRPVLGELAARYCQRVIVTTEDPYDEDPMAIINQVAKGAGEKAEKVLDRRKAITKALAGAEKGDVVVITGKGCEPCIIMEGGKRIPWDDREVAREEYENLYA